MELKVGTKWTPKTQPHSNPGGEWTIIEVSNVHVLCKSKYGTFGSWSRDQFLRKMWPLR